MENGTIRKEWRNRMLVEKSLKEALKYFINGKPVTVLYIGEDGGMDARKLEDTLNQKENHFLVDVPAIENPEFVKTLADMVLIGMAGNMTKTNGIPVMM